MIANADNFSRIAGRTLWEPPAVSTTESDAFEHAARLRRRLPRGQGWKVRTNKRAVKSDRYEVELWVVTAWRPTEDQPRTERKLASACHHEDPSSDLQ